MPESWKKIPLDAGTFSAFIAGVAAIVLAVYGIQHWIDNRIDSSLDSRMSALEERLNRMDTLESQITRMDARIMSMRQSMEDKNNKIERLLERILISSGNEP